MRIGEIVIDLKNGSTPTGGNFEEEGIPYFRSQDFNLFDFQVNQFITEDFHKKLVRSEIKSGDVLLAVVGATLGQVGFVPNSIERGNINQNVCRIRVIDKRIRPKFLSIYLASNIGKNLIYRNATITTQGYLNNEQLATIKIPELSIKQQIEIEDLFQNAYEIKKDNGKNAFNILGDLDTHIAQKIGFEFPKVAVKNTFAVKVSTFESRLDPHFYLPNFNALLDNIRKTKNAQLGDLVEFSKETWNQKDGFENEFPYIEISEIDLSSGKINNVSLVPISEAPSRAKMVIRTNDIIVSTTRPHRGAISLIEADKDGFIASTGFAILRNVKTDEISKEYLFYMLRTQICLQQMLQRSSGGSYPAITAEELKNIYLPIPAKAIQQEIVNDIKAFIIQAEQLKEEAKAEFEKAKQEIEALILN